MSDAMTNREIEDVLTSIRRLVAQDGRGTPETGRLILTEAQRIVGEAAPRPDAGPAGDEAGYAAPLELTDPVMTDEMDEGRAEGADGQDDRGEEDRGLPAPDFGQLEATIAELEAAVSGGMAQDEAEAGVPDPSPNATPAPGDDPAAAVPGADPAMPGDASNVTALYGRLNFQPRRPAVPAPEAGAAEDDPEAVEAAAEVAEDVAPDPAAGPVDAPEFEPADPRTPEDTVIDEAMLRALVAQIVREELHGQLGERITQQVRKLVRAEIARALDDRSYL